MDRLDEVLATAAPLLDRIDAALTHAGAPADHRVWQELRRVRLLPADAARAIAALRPAPLAEAVTDLRADARACTATAESLPAPGEWSGDAADAYDDLRRRTASHLAGGDESLDERLEATADLAQALSDWMGRTRVALAGALAEALGSSEGLTLMLAAPSEASPAGEVRAARPGASPPDEALAAATLAVRVLAPIADAYDEAADLLRASADLATPIPI